MNSRIIKAHLDHRRAWQDFDYAYPVISRRSRGVSLGLDLNPDKVCSFNCVYCEVDRLNPPRRKDLDLSQMEQEMSSLLDLTLSGELFKYPPFDSARPEQRRLNDIAFSGNGEPTLCKVFNEAVLCMARLLKDRGLNDVKLVLITNSTRLLEPSIQFGLQTLMENNGEIWAKLDAGTEDHYRRISRSGVAFGKVLENILETAKKWPITLQTLFLEWEGEAPSDCELEAYSAHISRFLKEGAKLQGLHLYTVARPTPELHANALPALQLEGIAQQLRSRFPGLAVEVFPGTR